MEQSNTLQLGRFEAQSGVSLRALRLWLLAVLLTMGLLASAPANAGPGCVGKFWNPITDVDFRLMGGIRIAGISLMQDPKHLGRPPKHQVSTICFCKDGWNTGFGFGLTYWMPVYLADVAREAGCIGFLDGINILPGFISLSSGQEYGFHSPGKDGVTNMQIHWAYADVMSIIGTNFFEVCDAVSSEFSIAYLTEPDFVFQNDIYSAVMTPQVAILSANAMLSQMTCGIESIANTLGGWQDFGMCGWKGTRMPLSGNTIAKDMAQVSNIDILLKYLARSALNGQMLRTMGKDVACKPKWAPFYEPFQHRYQWAYPAKVSTRYNIDVLRWGLFMKDGSLLGLQSHASDANAINNVNTTNTSASGNARNRAERIMAALPKPLNYPTREAGYMHVWEAKTCCLIMLTIETVMRYLAGQAFEELETLQKFKDIYEMAQDLEKIYNFATDPVGSALSLVGEGIATVFGDAMGEFGGVFGDMGEWFGGATASTSGSLAAAAGIRQSLQ